MDFSNLKDFMDRLTGWIIPGNSIVVYKDGTQVFSYQSGFSDLEKRELMRGGEMFHVYSCSKPTTVVAALQLYEKGYFLLDDPLYDFIPKFRHMQVRRADGSTEEAKTPITMRHLFTMTAGLGYNTQAPWRSRAEARTNGRMNTLDVARCIAEEPLRFRPKERYMYSMCHDVLAAAVEAISGQRFSEYVRTHIFDPLGMDSATYHVTEGTRARMAQQYEYKVLGENDLIKQQAGLLRGKDGVVVNVGQGNHLIFGEEYDSGGAGITVSVEDYAKFANALACGGVGETGEKILASGTIELLRKNQLTVGNIDCSAFGWGQLKGYGYGLGVRTMIDPAKAGFNGKCSEFGWGGAAGATILVDPDTRLAYFYAHHMLNPQETYYQPRLRNVVYSCL